MNSLTYVESSESHPEIPLVGGDVTEGVVRVGDTVRRPVGSHSPLVHTLLRHLEEVGFPGAPRFLGIHVATATHWVHQVGTSHAAYAADISRRDQHRSGV